jgi:hypothetical protein
MHYCGVFFQTLCKKPRLKKKKHKGTKNTDTNVKSDSSEHSLTPAETQEPGSDHSKQSESTETRDILGNVESTTTKIQSSEEECNVSPQIVQEMKHKSNLLKAWVLVMVFLAVNIPAAAYFGLIHQRGTVVVMKFLYDESFEKNMDVLFLMPCHSTPYYR